MIPPPYSLAALPLSCILVLAVWLWLRRIEIKAEKKRKAQRDNWEPLESQVN